MDLSISEDEVRQLDEGDDDSNAAKIIAFYDEHGCEPIRRQGPEHAVEALLARSLYQLRSRAFQNKESPSVKLLRQRLPQLLKRPPTMEEKARACVAHLSSKPSAQHPDTKKWNQFIKTYRKAIRKKPPSPDDEVYRILSEGLPDRFGRKRGRASSGEEDEEGEDEEQQQPPPLATPPRSKQPRRLPSSSPTAPSTPTPPIALASSLPATSLSASCRAQPGAEQSLPHAAAAWTFRGLTDVLAMCAASRPADPDAPSAPSASANQPQHDTAAASDSAQQTEAAQPPAALESMGQEEADVSPEVMKLLREMDMVNPLDDTVFVAGLCTTRVGKTEPAEYKGWAYGTACNVIQGPFDFRELEVVGLSSETGGRTYGYYSVTLSYLKAVWHVLTRKDGPFKFEPRLDPFLPDQYIFLFLGAPAHIKTGASGTAAAFMALIARFTKCRLRRDTAVTGVFTLTGQLEVIDHVNIKLAGAKGSGMTRVVIPYVNKHQVEERFKQDPDMEVCYASNVVELLHYCLEDGGGLDPKDSKLFYALVKPIGMCYYLTRGSQRETVECCAYKGKGKIRITGVELERAIEVTPANGFLINFHADAMHATALAGLTWLFAIEDSDWFQRLQRGVRRFSFKKMAIIEEEEKEEEEEEEKEEGVRLTETRADLHIHFPSPSAGGPAGMSTMLALAELMLGFSHGRCVAANGCVNYHGHVWLSCPMDEVTSTEFELILTSKLPGPQQPVLPKAPPGVEVKGFTSLKDVLELLYLEAEDGEEQGAGVGPGSEAHTQAGQASHTVDDGSN